MKKAHTLELNKKYVLLRTAGRYKGMAAVVSISKPRTFKSSNSVKVDIVKHIET